MLDELSRRTGVSLEQAKTSVTGVGSVVFGIVIIAVWLAVVWQMRAGRNWAQIVLTVLDLLVSVLYIAALAGAICYQFRPDANQFSARR